MTSRWEVWPSASGGWGGGRGREREGEGKEREEEGWGAAGGTDQAILRQACRPPTQEGLGKKGAAAWERGEEARASAAFGAGGGPALSQRRPAPGVDGFLAPARPSRCPCVCHVCRRLSISLVIRSPGCHPEPGWGGRAGCSLPRLQTVPGWGMTCWPSHQARRAGRRRVVWPEAGVTAQSQGGTLAGLGSVRTL